MAIFNDIPSAIHCREDVTTHIALEYFHFENALLPAFAVSRHEGAREIRDWMAAKRAEPLPAYWLTGIDSDDTLPVLLCLHKEYLSDP